ncbi:hypothetical protein CSX00_03810 [Pseudobutyrivibrio ruminis]|uniref:Uncharacterized protein n=1 Tax=Pseudobutyrivibrio ruminis TaxID=46206 RepID=A0A2G3EDE7_9FIRM|nr:hypothetical protein [Pseudobutyrivibrio ruminis]PHU41081.1 hypothetical protein CSX00_03810 [Pseudobutyrivibrio ruminis]
MCAMSQQVQYAELFKDIEYKLTNIDDYAWGEELYEFPLIVYIKNRSTIPNYGRVCQESVEVGLITINPHAEGMIEVVPAMYWPTNKNIYIKDDVFNKYWRHLKKSVAIGIENNPEYCQEHGIETPEDIVNLRILKTPDKEPYVSYHGKIKFKTKEKIEPKGTSLKRARQSKLDNPKNIFFYSSNRDGSRQVHDKECEVLDSIPDDKFSGSNEVPDGYILCKKCKRKLLIRMGCYPNSKQIPMCGSFFHKHRVATTEIEQMIDKGITFHVDDMSVMTINGIEDTWQIRAVGEEVSLWHNNYVKVSDTERYITDGFHDQKCPGSMTNMIHYIEGYTWKKHLAAEERKKLRAEEEARIAVVAGERRTHWYYRLIDRIKDLLKRVK